MKLILIITNAEGSEKLAGDIDEYFKLPRAGDFIIQDNKEVVVNSVTHNYDDDEIIIKADPK